MSSVDVGFGVVQNGHKSAARSLDRIAELAQTLALILEDAEDAGARKPHSLAESNGRGKGFADVDPVASMVLDPTRAQLRGAVRRAVFAFSWSVGPAAFSST